MSVCTNSLDDKKKMDGWMELRIDEARKQMYRPKTRCYFAIILVLSSNRGEEAEFAVV